MLGLKTVATSPSIKKITSHWRLELNMDQVFALDDLLDKFLNEEIKKNPEWFHGMDIENLSESHRKLMSLIQKRIDRGEI